jgi:hypothetical protein
MRELAILQINLEWLKSQPARFVATVEGFHSGL